MVVIPAAICAAGKVKDLVAHLKQKYPKEYESKYSYYNFDELKNISVKSKYQIY